MTAVPTSKTTVLIADPDIAYREVVADCLKSRFHIITANSLAETIEMIAQYHPAILLLELNQPDGDGTSIIPRLKANPETHKMVISCLTTRTSIDEKVAGFQAGADDYVVKPINTRMFMYRMALLTRVRRR
jgi:DNA-binding response OmpR family regulator